MGATENITVQRPTTTQHTMADFLLSICPAQGFLVKHHDKQKYISLDEQIGKSKQNKNVVGVHRTNVSFMVGDWSFTSRAEQIGLAYEQIDNANVGKRLAFPQLTIQIIEGTADTLIFFKDLLVASKQEAQDRQTRRSSLGKTAKIKTKGNPQSSQGIEI